MRWPLILLNGSVLAGLLSVLALGGESDARSLLPRRPALDGAADIGALEAQASLAQSAANVAALASAYLERGEPGLASAVIERAPPDVQIDLHVAELSARALFRRGRPRQALAAVQGALAHCSNADASCRPWQIAKATHAIAFLEEVVAAGIEDPQTDPAAVRAAYERSSQHAGLVAMR
jgi:hypothetical protein